MNSKRNYMIVECSDINFSKALIYINKKKKFIHTWISSNKKKSNINFLYNQDCINGVNFINQKINFKKKIRLSKNEFYLAKNMLKRQNPLGNLSQLNQNKLINFFLNNWSNYLKKNKIKSVIFYSTPHLTYSYLIYCLCRKFSIKTKILEKTKYLNYYFFFENINENNILQKFRKNCKSQKYIKNYINQFKYGNNIQTHSVIFNESKIELIRIFLRTFIRPFFKENLIEYFFKKKKTRFHNYTSFLPFDKRSFHTKFKDYYFYFKAYFICQKLKKNYENKSIEIKNLNNDNKYILFAANYQPEKSTSPDANEYYDQIKILTILNNFCSKNKNYKILYKEHPSQFLSKRFGFMEKNENYYRKLFKFKNVICLKLETPTFEAINKSLIISTATSEMALQSILLNKPSIIFGNVWFSKCKGVYKYQKNLSNLIKTITKKKLYKRAVEVFLNCLDNNKNLNMNSKKNF